MNFSTFGGFEKKKNIFGIRKILWIFWVVIPKLDKFWGLFLCILGSFLKVNIQNQDILGVAKISIIFGVLDTPDTFWGKQYMLGPSISMRKK